MRRGAGTVRSRMSGKPVQMIGLVIGETQGSRESTQHLLGRLGAAGLFQPAVLVDRHPRKLRYFFTPQARGPTA